MLTAIGDGDDDDELEFEFEHPPITIIMVTANIKTQHGRTLNMGSPIFVISSLRLGGKATLLEIKPGIQ